MIKPYIQPVFLICVGILALAAISMPYVIEAFGVVLEKEPLPIKKSLEFLDNEDLGPYRVIEKKIIDNDEILESLGTEDYIQWRLEDTQAEPNSKIKSCLLFITYYSLPDRVPHVPEECYTGTGYQKLDSEPVSFSIAKKMGISKTGNDDKKEIPGRCLVFSGKSANNWFGNLQFSVLYLFNVNGTYVNNRERARKILNLSLGKYAYFSKVEWQFLGNRGARVYLEKGEAVEASEKLLNVILPVLEKDYWPMTTSIKGENDD
ncbi:MAG: hypothetical protein ACYSSI_10110 [Planctomycetota bacterium]|jgi:hypothetical protein